MAVYYSYIAEFKPLPQNFKLGPIRLKRRQTIFHTTKTD